MCIQLLSCICLFATPWTIALQAPLSMEHSRQEYWSGLPFPPLGNLPRPRDWTCISCGSWWEARVLWVVLANYWTWGRGHRLLIYSQWVRSTGDTRLEAGLWSRVRSCGTEPLVCANSGSVRTELNTWTLVSGESQLVFSVGKSPISQWALFSPHNRQDRQKSMNYGLVELKNPPQIF